MYSIGIMGEIAMVDLETLSEDLNSTVHSLGRLARAGSRVRAEISGPLWRLSTVVEGPDMRVRVEPRQWYNQRSHYKAVDRFAAGKLILSSHERFDSATSQSQGYELMIAAISETEPDATLHFYEPWSEAMRFSLIEFSTPESAK